MRSIRLALLPAFALVVMAVPASAQTKTLSIDEALRIVRDNGLASVSKLELDDNEWEAEGRNGAGQRIEIDIDSVTGKVLKTETD